MTDVPSGIGTRDSAWQTSRIAFPIHPLLALATGYGWFEMRENHNATGISAAP